MTKIGQTFLLFLLGGWAVSANAADFATTLMPPNGAIVAGGNVVLDLVAINPRSVEVEFEATQKLSGQLVTAGGSWTVDLLATGAAATAVAPGGFAVHRYALALPGEASGRAVLEVTQTGASPLRAVLDLAPRASAPSAETLTPLSELASSTRAIDSVINRTFAGRLVPNDPIYFIYGRGKHAAAKFQFSFNYRLATFDWGSDAHPQTSILQFGYTQRSLWDIDAHSSPFYDTSYMPEMSVDTLVNLPAKKAGWFTWIGLRTGVQHESNGRSGPDSRSLNTAYLRPMFAVGQLDSWHLVVLPEVFGYVSSLDENDRLKDYRGYGRLRMVFGKNNGPSLLFAGWMGKRFDHPTYQLDLAYPIRVSMLKLESFVVLQYFDGYGESLVSYDKKSNALRFGLELLR